MAVPVSVTLISRRWVPSSTFPKTSYGDAVDLKEVDLSPLTNVRGVAGCFLMDCAGLAHIDLAPLHAIEEVTLNFLQGCVGLREVDLGPLVNVKNVRGCFLDGCAGLTHIDLAPLRGVGTIARNFLRKCSALKEVDLTPLTNVREVGGCFLMGCAGTAPAPSPHWNALTAALSWARAGAGPPLKISPLTLTKPTQVTSRALPLEQPPQVVASSRLSTRPKVVATHPPSTGTFVAPPCRPPAHGFPHAVLANGRETR